MAAPALEEWTSAPYGRRMTVTPEQALAAIDHLLAASGSSDRAVVVHEHLSPVPSAQITEIEVFGVEQIPVPPIETA